MIDAARVRDTERRCKKCQSSLPDHVVAFGSSTLDTQV